MSVVPQRIAIAKCQQLKPKAEAEEASKESESRLLAVMCHLPILALLALAVLGTEQPSGRLNLAVVPLHYNLEITTLVDKPRAPYVGKVVIEVAVKQSTRRIALHGKKLQLVKQNVTVTGKKSRRRWPVSSIEELTKFDQLHVLMEHPLQVGLVYELSIRFMGQLSLDEMGYYRSHYPDQSTTLTRWLSATQFEPTNARNAFPCFDDPMFKTPFIISLAHHKKFTALSNMPMQKQIKHASRTDFVWSMFHESLPMPTYLVAFSINMFKQRNSQNSKISTWARPDAYEQTAYAALIAPDLLKYFATFFEIPVPLPKVDQLALPDFAYEASESWGLNGYSEMNILYDENRGTLLDKQRVALNVAKQMVHQWFGNLVSISWWNDVWLKDAFADYLAGFAVEQLDHTWEYQERRTLQFEFATLELDAHIHSSAVVTPVANESEIGNAYNKASVTKAAVLLGMLHNLIGDRIMMRSIRNYLRTHANKTATRMDFWAAVQQEADRSGSLPKGIDVQHIMRSWILQKGYPLLNVTRDYERGTAKVTQSRFFLSPPQMADNQVERQAKNDSYCWWVPLTYTTRASADFNATLPRNWLICMGVRNHYETPPATLKVLSSPDDWLILNLRLSAPCRVNYDLRNWGLINETLAGDDYKTIDTLNRAQLVDDALSLAWSGLQPYNLTLGLLNFLRREDEYVVWGAASRALERVNSIMKQTSGYLVFKTYMRWLLTPKFEELFVNEKEKGDASGNMLFRTVILQLSCLYELPACITRARAEYAKLKSYSMIQGRQVGGGNLPVDMHDTIYCTAIRFGAESDWTELKSNFARSNLATEQGRIASALGCSRDVASLEIALKWAFGTVRKHIAVRVFKSVVSNPTGYQVATKFVTEHIDLIRNFCINSTVKVVQLLKPLFEELTTLYDLQQVQKLLEDNMKDLIGIQEAINLLLELGRDNINWRRHKYFELMQAIKQVIPTNNTATTKANSKTSTTPMAGTKSTGRTTATPTSSTDPSSDNTSTTDDGNTSTTDREKGSTTDKNPKSTTNKNPKSTTNKNPKSTTNKNPNSSTSTEATTTQK